MRNDPLGATAEGLPASMSRREAFRALAGGALAGFAAATLVVAIPASIAMPDDLPAYMVNRWPTLSAAQRETVANGWIAMDAECRAAVEAWCQLDDAGKDRVIEAVWP